MSVHDESFDFDADLTDDDGEDEDGQNDRGCRRPFEDDHFSCVMKQVETQRY
jgi:hypothetical protein